MIGSNHHNHIHGETHTKFYNCWSDMKKRVLCKTGKAYKNYGGRGISLSEDWHNYLSFRDDMKKSYDEVVEKYPNERITLERIDNNGNYCKENCKWIPLYQQSKNTRSCVFIEYKGEKKTISDWAREYGLQPETLRRRLKVHNWPFEVALTASRYEYRGKLK